MHYGSKGGRRLGAAMEERFLRCMDLMQQAGNFPEWLIGFRFANLEQDRHGVDFWALVHPDFRFPIDVKASPRVMRKHNANPNRNTIPAVLVQPEDSAQDVFVRVLKTLQCQLALHGVEVDIPA